MTKDDSLRPDDDDGAERIKGSGGNKKGGMYSATFRSYAMKWRNAPRKGSQEGPTLRAELFPDVNLMHILGEDEEEEEDEGVDPQESFRQNFSRRFLKSILDDLEFYTNWPGTLEPEEMKSSEGLSSDSDY